MVRPGRRKCLEEVYGAKLDSIHSVKSHVGTGVGITKSATMRTDRSGITGGTGGGEANGMGMGIGGPATAATTRKPDARTQHSFVTANDYYITTNLPITASNLRNVSSSMAHVPNMSSHVLANPYVSPYNAINSRRGTVTSKATARKHQQSKVPHFSLPENKAQVTSNAMIKQKDQQHQHRLNGGHNKTMTQRSSYVTAGFNGIDNNMGTEFSDKELMLPATGGCHTRRSHSHHHQHGHMHVHQQQVQQAHPLQHQLHQQQQLNYPQSHNHVHQQPIHANHPQNRQNNRQQVKVHIPGQGVNKIPVTPADDNDDDDCKDDDPDEFFELIRQTVQKAIGSTISEILDTNFRDLTHKMDRFNGELKMTNEHLEKLQDQVTNKVVHYGEENSRNFRYLCMKSEYDKMFYQHQTMIAGKHELPTELGNQPSQLTISSQRPVVSSASGGGGATYNGKPNKNLKYTSKLPKHFNAQKMNNNNLKKETIDSIKVQNPCSCRTTSKATQQQQQKLQQTGDTQNSVSDQSVDVKSSELGMREVLGQIQRFCTQMQLGDVKENEQLPFDLEDALNPKTGMGLKHSSEESTLKDGSSNAGRKDADSDLETPVDSMDETYIEMDDFSSEDMSSVSDEDSDTKYPNGANTARANLKSTRIPPRSSHKGAGDGQ